MQSKSSAKSITIEAKIIRKDGTEENLGVISKTNKDTGFQRILKLLGDK